MSDFYRDLESFLETLLSEYEDYLPSVEDKTIGFIVDNYMVKISVNVFSLSSECLEELLQRNNEEEDG